MPKAQPKEDFEYCPKAYSNLRSNSAAGCDSEWDAQHLHCSPVGLTQVSQAGKWRSAESTLLRCYLPFLLSMSCQLQGKCVWQMGRKPDTV